jgi:hypothetical protein
MTMSFMAISKTLCNIPPMSQIEIQSDIFESPSKSNIFEGVPIPSSRFWIFPTVSSEHDLTLGVTVPWSAVTTIKVVEGFLECYYADRLKWKRKFPYYGVESIQYSFSRNILLTSWPSVEFNSHFPLRVGITEDPVLVRSRIDEWGQSRGITGRDLKTGRVLWRSGVWKFGQWFAVLDGSIWTLRLLNPLALNLSYSSDKLRVSPEWLLEEHSALNGRLRRSWKIQDGWDLYKTYSGYDYSGLGRRSRLVFFTSMGRIEIGGKNAWSIGQGGKVKKLKRVK